MGLVDLYSPHTDWNLLWFNNWISHQDIVQAVMSQKNIALTMYQIDPWIDADSDNILGRHAQYHQDMNAVLGVNGADLSVLDINDKDKVQWWIWQHFMEHQAAHTALKL